MIWTLLYYLALGIGFFFVALFAIIGLILLPGVYENWKIARAGGVSSFNINKPDERYYSSDDPPWKNPRKIRSSNSSRRDLADYNMLMKRLELVDMLPREQADWGEPKLYVDRETGQHWRWTSEDYHFSQWYELNPVEAPPAKS